MTDSNPKKNSIPSWQQRQSSTEQPQDAPSSTRTALLEQATKFLQDESIRDAPTDRKIAFLESKGLDNDEIQSLLGVSRNAEASSTSTTTQTPEDEAAAAATTTTATTTTKPLETRSDDKLETNKNRDIPPIITYPEFLFQPTSSKPAPLFTARSILSTLYGAAGLGATLYGASEYLVKPMLSQLTAARHELAETATSNLRTLNTKLEANVSRIPPPPPSKSTRSTTTTSADSDDQDSVTSDPTELFHRDVATQTSPDLVHPLGSSLAAPTDELVETPHDPAVAVGNHIQRLQVISSHLREFAEAEKDSGAVEDGVRTRLNDLHLYLDTLIYSGPSYMTSTAYGGFGSPSMMDGAAAGTATGMRSGEEDAISAFKAEIRGVKGALLSARNFPSGRGVRVGR